ncbi:MAG: hypothetical protein HY884_01860 [Deltaproteobacteria bacterium]|nr:hypothetical protein [Deltaproteobacteria bacterium]
MSEKKRMVTGNNALHSTNISGICREISIKDICEECERTSLYPEENCGCPATVVICEDVESPSKSRLPKAGL